MKKIYMILLVCALFPISLFAANSEANDVIVESGIKSLPFVDTCSDVHVID